MLSPGSSASSPNPVPGLQTFSCWDFCCCLKSERCSSSASSSATRSCFCEIHILVLSAISCDSRISSIWFISDGTIHLSFIGYCWPSSCADEIVYLGLHIWLSSWQTFQKKFVNQQVCINTYVFSLNSAPFEGVSCALLVQCLSSFCWPLVSCCHGG